MDDFTQYRSGRMDARTLRRNQGLSMTTQARDRQMTRRDDIDLSIRDQLRRQRQERILATIDQTGMTTRTGMEQVGQTVRTGMEQGAMTTRQQMEGETRMGVAGLDANARMYGADQQLAGTKAQARASLLGNVVSGWMNRGIEKLRQKGDTDRLATLIGQSGFKQGASGAEVFMDATGKGMEVKPPQQQGQPKGQAVWDETTGRFLGYNVTDGSGKATFQPFKRERNPYDPNLAPQAWQKFEDENGPPQRPQRPQGQQPPQAGQQPAANPARWTDPQRPPLNNAQQQQDGSYTMTDRAGKIRKLRFTPEGWQLEGDNGWVFLTRG